MSLVRDLQVIERMRSDALAKNPRILPLIAETQDRLIHAHQHAELLAAPEPVAVQS